MHKQKRVFFFLLELMNMLYLEHGPLFPEKESMHLYIQEILSINASR